MKNYYGGTVYDRRTDLCRYLTHLTRSDSAFTSLDRIVSILQSGLIKASDHTGFIKAGCRATCFMDVPPNNLRAVVETCGSKNYFRRFDLAGIIFQKAVGYVKGVRPVLYLSDAEMETLQIPLVERWRVVELNAETVEDGNLEWVNWMHEREWRCEGDFTLADISGKFAVVVGSNAEKARLDRRLIDLQDTLAAKPLSVVSLQ